MSDPFDLNSLDSSAQTDINRRRDPTDLKKIPAPERNINSKSVNPNFSPCGEFGEFSGDNSHGKPEIKIRREIDPKPLDPFPDNPDEAENNTEPYEPGPLGGIMFDDVSFDPRAPYIIKGVIEPGTKSVFYGDTSIGKTFIVLDAAAHVAAGLDWFGHRVKQTAVCYIASEGGHGVKKRVDALGQKLRKLGVSDPVPFVLIPTTVNLRDNTEDMGKLREEILGFEKYVGMKVGLIVIDTLSSAIAGGSDSDPKDIGPLIMNASKLQSEFNSPHVLIVHHCGKDPTRGMRGSSMLPADVATVVELVRDKETRVTTGTLEKQRDGADGTAFVFELEQVKLGIDQDGDFITTCIVKPSDAPAADRKSEKKLSPDDVVALDILKNLIALEGKPLPGTPDFPTSRTMGVTQRRFGEEYYGTVTDGVTNDKERAALRRTKARLKVAGKIAFSGNYVWLT